MSTCGISQSCGASQAQLVESAKVAADATNSGQLVKSIDISSAPNTGSINAPGSGGSTGTNIAYKRAGCSTDTCGSRAAVKTSGTCGTRACGDEAGAKKAEKSDCSKGQCDGKKGLFKATIMTVAASELSQLTIDYSQYLS
jgi:hypothetical protein